LRQGVYKIIIDSMRHDTVNSCLSATEWLMTWQTNRLMGCNEKHNWTLSQPGNADLKFLWTC